jgi:Ni/Co efflux regulator RcnB
MKRTAIAALAALVAAGPLAATSASAQDFRGDRGGRYDNDRARDGDRSDRGDRDGRNDRDGRRDQRGERWDRSRDNGYYVNGRFYFGQPSFTIMQRRDFRPGYMQWRRGERLPYYARASFRQVDWRRAHLRQPPRGYHYVRDDRGEILLVGVATGVILSILLNN